MDITQVVQTSIDAEAALRAWDWRAALKAEERSIGWLARHTGKAQRTVYDYAYGITVPSIEWLRAAARVLEEGVR